LMWAAAALSLSSSTLVLLIERRGEKVAVVWDHGEMVNMSMWGILGWYAMEMSTDVQGQQAKRSITIDHMVANPPAWGQHVDQQQCGCTVATRHFVHFFKLLPANCLPVVPEL